MTLLHQLIQNAAERDATAAALHYRGVVTDYGQLANQVARASGGLLGCGIRRGDRVAIYLPRQPESVVAFFAAAMAGVVFVPVNPQLKAAQVAHILDNCDARVLITTAFRAANLAAVIENCGGLHTVVLCDDDVPVETTKTTIRWEQLLSAEPRAGRSIDADLATLLYTSGSTGKPKGVMLSHRNLVAGATSISSYLQNRTDDRLLTVLPFSFDYGFSQLSSAFLVGASVVLFEYLLARDVIRAVERDRVTGLACVPPVWIQLAKLDWPDAATRHLRYITNSGGAMPGSTLDSLRRKLPDTDIFLMYGLTEAFRSTYLDPGEVARRPNSIGKAVPNAEILVVRPDGTPCGPNEPGELVHRGSLVGMGYWNDADKTAERFKPSPLQPQGATLPEIAVWSGDTVQADDDGFLYFVGRRDEMIKTSGYRVSPNEVEEVLYSSGLVAEVTALGVPHPDLGQVIVVVAVAHNGDGDTEALLKHCRATAPNYMVPAHVAWRPELPQNANGKIDRQELTVEFAGLFQSTDA